MVIQQVDLVDVQYAPVGLGEQAGLERLNALGERLLDVDGATDAVLGGAEGQVDHGDLGGGDREAGVPTQHPLADLRPHHLWVVRVGVEGVADDDADVREQVDEGAHGGGLARAPVAHDHHAADLGVDDVEQQAELHLVLPHDGRERVHGPLALLRGRRRRRLLRGSRSRHRMRGHGGTNEGLPVPSGRRGLGNVGGVPARRRWGRRHCRR